MTVDLGTKARRIACRVMNLSIPDWQLENTSESIGVAVITFTSLSLLLTVLTMAFGAVTFWRTKKYVNDLNKDLGSEYFRFVRCWDIIVFFSDVLTLYGTKWILLSTVHSEVELGVLDSYTVLLGIGCFLAWFGILRFFNFHIKFSLLLSTLYRAMKDVIAYLICVAVLFVGFWVCGYVVMAPYHVKFQTPSAAAETLLSILNGDEIYATLAILENDKSGGNGVWWFSRFYIGAYVTIFTIVVINMLITLFMGAYETIKSSYDEREIQPIKDSKLSKDDCGLKDEPIKPENSRPATLKGIMEETDVDTCGACCCKFARFSDTNTSQADIYVNGVKL